MIVGFAIPVFWSIPARGSAFWPYQLDLTLLYQVSFAAQRMTEGGQRWRFAGISRWPSRFLLFFFVFYKIFQRVADCVPVLH